MYGIGFVRVVFVFVVVSLVIVSFESLAIAQAPEASQIETHPNVLLIIGDDQAWTDFGFMDHPQIRTPNLDRLAKESLFFRRGYVPCSLCRASLATIVTGLLPSQHRITSNDPALPRGKRFKQENEQMIANIDRVDTIPRLLAENGYACLQTGKWWEGNFKRGGFTHGMTHGDSERGGRHGDEGLKIGRQGLEPVEKFLDQTKGKPFFIWYAPFLPHTPHNPPGRLLDKYRSLTESIHVAKYWAMCEWFDETCGQLLKTLSDRELDKNTIVIFVTDNGWIQKLDAGGYAPRSKRSPYDTGLRTPIMVRWPGKQEPATIETPVSSIDIGPTILSACKCEIPKAMGGLNLIEHEKISQRGAIFGEVFAHNAVNIERPDTSLLYRWVVSGDWKMIAPTKKAPKGSVRELYNLKIDPYEGSNVFGKNAQTQRLLDLLSQHKSTLSGDE